jgi:MinD superfamily P-loop ATPase
MRELVVMSGKGGTGKTSLAAALGVLAGAEAVVADCDVDAADLHLLYRPVGGTVREFRGGKKARIDPDRCVACGVCFGGCRFDAIREENGAFVVDATSCEGCSVCRHLCPEGAVTMIEARSGVWSVAKSRFGNWFVHARLDIGGENSGKLVARVKQEARRIAEENGIPLVLIDGPPGIGCPAISSISGAGHVLVVTEPTRSGAHDLARLVDLIESFGVEASCVVNKWDVNPEVAGEIERFCGAHRIEVLARIPYDPAFSNALRDGRTLVETNETKLVEVIVRIWNRIRAREEAG